MRDGSDPCRAETSVTGLLVAWGRGDERALDQLMPLVYAELLRVARRQLRSERAGHTLETAALVHEAYLRLVDQTRVAWVNRAQFFAVAAQAMRRVLVDHARRRNAARRDPGLRVTLGDGTAATEARVDEVLTIDQALHRLEEMDARQGRIVVLRYFAGMTIDETAAALDISPATVKREWLVAKAWLKRELAAGVGT